MRAKTLKRIGALCPTSSTQQIGGGKKKRESTHQTHPKKTRLFRRRNFSSFRWSWSLLLALALIGRGGQIEGHEEKESFFVPNSRVPTDQKNGHKKREPTFGLASSIISLRALSPLVFLRPSQ